MPPGQMSQAQLFAEKKRLAAEKKKKKEEKAAAAKAAAANKASEGAAPDSQQAPPADCKCSGCGLGLKCVKMGASAVTYQGRF